MGRATEQRILAMPPSSRLTIEVETDRNGHVRPRYRIAVLTGEDLEEQDTA